MSKHFMDLNLFKDIGAIMERTVSGFAKFGRTLCPELLSACLKRFLTGTSGAVSVEFVLILPALISLFILFASGSILLVTSSQVQQVSFELTRGSLRYYEPGMPAATLCSALETELAPSVIKTGDFLSASRFTHIKCDLDTADALTVTVTYDMANHPIMALANLIGIDISEMNRSSKMWL